MELSQKQLARGAAFCRRMACPFFGGTERDGYTKCGVDGKQDWRCVYPQRVMEMQQNE